MKTLCRICFLLAIVSASSVQAMPIEGCAAVEVTDNHGTKFTFWQHQFVDDTRDLVMSQSQSSDIKRVTFSNNQACAYQVLAIAEGVGWGWHLAWADEQNIYYARMDGEAWVSSVPKKFAADNVSELHFTQEKSLLILSWQAEGTGLCMQSDDEGRSWQAPIIK